MSRIDEARQWARTHFGSARLKDARRTERLVSYAAAAALRPGASIPRQCGNWPATKGAYRLFSGDAVCYQRVMQGHWLHTREAAAACGTVLFVQDTTTLCFDHPRTAGLGSTSAKGDHGSGMLLHSALAIDVDGKEPRPIGLAHGQLWARDQGRRMRVESGKWSEAIRAVGAAPGGSRWVHVGDAESDCWEAFEAAEASRVGVVLRSGQERLALAGHDPQGPASAAPGKLWEMVRQSPVLASKWIYVRRRPGREPGCVRLNVSAMAVSLMAPRNWAQKRHRSERPKPPPMRLWAVRVWEAQPPPGQEPIEWVLLTNQPVVSARQALEVAGWYAGRWIVEEYHKCLKTGCRVEQRQLEEAERLEPLVGVLSAVAVRLLRLKTMARAEPHAPAEGTVEEKYVRVLAAYRKLDRRKLNNRAFWVEVAKMGGFLARRSDGDPGWQTTWRGWKELQVLTAGYELALNRRSG